MRPLTCSARPAGAPAGATFPARHVTTRTEKRYQRSIKPPTCTRPSLQGVCAWAQAASKLIGINGSVIPGNLPWGSLVDSLAMLAEPSMRASGRPANVLAREEQLRYRRKFMSDTTATDCHGLPIVTNTTADTPVPTAATAGASTAT